MRDRRAGPVLSAPGAASPRGRAAAYLEMLHLPPVIVVLVAAALITAIVSYPPPWPDLGLFLGSLLVSQLAISLHNDYCDRTLDAQVKPWRALPRGLVTPGLALALVAALLAAAVLLAAPLGLDIVLLGVLGTGCGLLYNARLKRTLFVWAPFAIALPTLAIACLLLADAYTTRALFAYAVGLPLGLAVYLVDTTGDADSDRAAGVRSLTAVLGARRARFVARFAVLAAAAAGALAFGERDTLPLFALPVALVGVAAAAASRLPRLHWPLAMSAVVAVAAASAVGIA